jgi:hypothetical protein
MWIYTSSPPYALIIEAQGQILIIIIIIIITTQILGATSLFQCSEILKPSCHLLLSIPTFPV